MFISPVLIIFLNLIIAHSPEDVNISGKNAAANACEILEGNFFQKVPPRKLSQVRFSGKLLNGDRFRPFF
jgi:hypothetical protein